MSDNSDSSSARSESPEVKRLKELVLEETEAFGVKLTTEVKIFITKTTTFKDEIRAMIRCLRECINIFNDAGELGVEEETIPVANASENLGKDELRSIAKKLLKFCKRNILESFLETLHPNTTVATQSAINALETILSTIYQCKILIDRVINDGFNCLISSSSNDEDEG